MRTIYGYGAAGLVPFVSLSLAAYFGVADAVEGVSSATVLTGMITYGAVILSFLAGTLWMNGVRRAVADERPRLDAAYAGWPAIGALWCSAGICLSLSAWAALLLAIEARAFGLALAVNGAGFALLLAIEWIQRKTLDYGRGYWRLRCVLSAVVLLCHALALASLA